MLSEKAKTSLDKVITQFKSGDIGPIFDIALIQPHPDDHKPADAWSLSNRVLAFMQTGDLDCRGFHQWKEAGRSVMKGTHAAYILAPLTKRTEDENTGDKKTIVFGFKYIPVFASIQTDGEELPSYDYQPVTLPPLQEAAQRFGLKTTYCPTPGNAYGSYAPGRKTIALHTHNTKTWFHELAHAAHDTIEPLRNGQDPAQETVAEFTAVVLMHMYGYPDQTGNTWQYISSYNTDPLKAICQALSTIEKVLAVLLTKESDHVPSKDS